MTELRKPYTLQTWPGYKWITCSIWNDNKYAVKKTETSGVSDVGGDFWSWAELAEDPPILGSHDGKTWYPCYDGGEASAVQSERVPTDEVSQAGVTPREQSDNSLTTKGLAVLVEQCLHLTEALSGADIGEEHQTSFDCLVKKLEDAEAILNRRLAEQTPDDAVRCDEAALKAQLAHAQKMLATEVQRSRDLAEKLTAEIGKLKAELVAERAKPEIGDAWPLNAVLVEVDPEIVEFLKWRNYRLKRLGVTDGREKIVGFNHGKESWFITDSGDNEFALIAEPVPNADAVDRMVSGEMKPSDPVIRYSDEANQLKLKQIELNGEIARLQSELAASKVECQKRNHVIRRQTEVFVQKSRELDSERRWQERLRELNETSDQHILALVPNRRCVDGEWSNQWDVADVINAPETKYAAVIGHGPTPSAAVDAAAKALGVTFEDEQAETVAEPQVAAVEAVPDVPASVLDGAREAWRLFKRIDAAGLAMGYGAGFSVDGVDFHLTIRRMTFPRFVERSEDRTDAEIGKSLGGEEAGVEAKSSVESIPLSSQPGDLIVRRDTNGDFLLILDGRYVKPDVRWNQIGRIYEWMIDGELEWAETPEDHARDDAFIREMIARNPVKASPQVDSATVPEQPPRFALTPDGCGVLDRERPGMVSWFDDEEAGLAVLRGIRNGTRQPSHWKWEPYTLPEAAVPEPSAVEKLTLDRLARITEQMEAGTYEAKVTTVTSERPNPQVGETWEDGYGNLVGPLESTDSDNAYFKTHPLSYQGFTYMADGRYVDSGTSSEADLVRRVDSISEPNQGHADGQQQVGGGGVQGQLCASQVGDSAKDQSNKDIQSGTAMDVAVPTPLSAIDHHAAPAPHPGDVTQNVMCQIVCGTGRILILLSKDTTGTYSLVFRDTGVDHAVGSYCREDTQVSAGDFLLSFKNIESADVCAEQLDKLIRTMRGELTPEEWDANPGDSLPSGANSPLSGNSPPFSEDSPPSDNPPLLIEVGGRYLCRDGVTTAEVIGKSKLINPKYPFIVLLRNPTNNWSDNVASDGRVFDDCEDPYDLIRRLPDVVTVEVDPEIVAFLKSQGARVKFLGAPKLGEPYVDLGTMAIETCSEFDSDKFVLVCEIVDPIPAVNQEGV